MTPSTIHKRVVVDRIEWVQRMVATIEALPLEDKGQFFADDRNILEFRAMMAHAP